MFFTKIERVKKIVYMAVSVQTYWLNFPTVNAEYLGGGSKAQMLAHI